MKWITCLLIGWLWVGAVATRADVTPAQALSSAKAYRALSERDLEIVRTYALVVLSGGVLLTPSQMLSSAKAYQAVDDHGLSAIQAYALANTSAGAVLQASGTGTNVIFQNPTNYWKASSPLGTSGTIRQTPFWTETGDAPARLNLTDPFSGGVLMQLRADSSPNHVIYMPPSGIWEALSLQVLASPDGNTDPRITFVFGDYFTWRVHETNLTWTSAVLGSGNDRFWFNASATTDNERFGDFNTTNTFAGTNLFLQAGNINRSEISGQVIALTQATATQVFTVTLANNKYAGLRIFATTSANNGTDYQSTTEELVIAFVNKAGTIAAPTVSSSSPSASKTSSGTLTTAWTCTVSGTTVTVKNNANSSLASSPVSKCVYRVDVDTDDTTMVLSP